MKTRWIQFAFWLARLLVLNNVAPLWEIMLAAMKLGVVVIPATTLLTTEELADRVKRGRARMIITDEHQVAKCDGLPKDGVTFVNTSDTPIAGRVTRFHYLPGRLWPVFPAATRRIRDLFSRNERLVTWMESAAGTVAGGGSVVALALCPSRETMPEVSVAKSSTPYRSCIIPCASSCAITSAGGLQCWGSGSGGRIGDGTENSTATPVDVVGLSSGVEAVSAGSETTCALVGGGAKCWGARVGDGVSPYGSSLVPVDVQGMTSGVRQVDVGNGFTCFVTTSSNVQCLGDNGWGQLGDGTVTRSEAYPLRVIDGRVSTTASKETAPSSAPAVISSSGGAMASTSWVRTASA